MANEARSRGAGCKAELATNDCDAASLFLSEHDELQRPSGATQIGGFWYEAPLDTLRRQAMEDRPAFMAALKAAGMTKIGERLAFEQQLLSSAACDAGSAAAPPADGLPTCFIESAFPTRREFEQSLLLRPAERVFAENAARRKVNAGVAVGTVATPATHTHGLIHAASHCADSAAPSATGERPLSTFAFHLQNAAGCLPSESLPSDSQSEVLSVPVKIEAVTPGAECYWLRGALSAAEQVRLFEFVKARDRTDWENLPVCMNPSPKTLQLEQPGGGPDTAPTLACECRRADDSVASAAVDVVDRVRRILLGHSILLAGRALTEPTSISLAAIRYQSPDGRFPPHIDHCNDGSWVFLFSLGCSARFRVRAPRMDSPHELQLQSGDALVFDPSSGAGIVHEVVGIGEGASCPRALGETFAELRSFRYGVQCRVRF